MHVRDRKPLHSDPEFAAAAGFPRLILHGLCTYGMTCKAMVDALPLRHDTVALAGAELDPV
jgi:acyl dehydratase